jgi:hypothetical protein
MGRGKEEPDAQTILATWESKLHAIPEEDLEAVVEEQAVFLSVALSEHETTVECRLQRLKDKLIDLQPQGQHDLLPRIKALLAHIELQRRGSRVCAAREPMHGII